GALGADRQGREGRQRARAGQVDPDVSEVHAGDRQTAREVIHRVVGGAVARAIAVDRGDHRRAAAADADAFGAAVLAARAAGAADAELLAGAGERDVSCRTAGGHTGRFAGASSRGDEEKDVSHGATPWHWTAAYW